MLSWLRVLLVTWMKTGDPWSWAIPWATPSVLLSTWSSIRSSSSSSRAPGDGAIWPMACPRGSSAGWGRMGEMRLLGGVVARVRMVWGGVEVTVGWYPLGGVTGSSLILGRSIGRGRGIGSFLGGTGASSQMTSCPWPWKTSSSRSLSLTSSNWSTSQEATPESVRLAPLPCLVDFLTAAA